MFQAGLPMPIVVLLNLRLPCISCRRPVRLGVVPVKSFLLLEVQLNLTIFHYLEHEE